MIEDRIYKAIEIFEREDPEYHNFLFGIISMLNVDDLDDFYKILKSAKKANKKIAIKEPNEEFWDSLLISNIVIDESE